MSDDAPGGPTGPGQGTAVTALAGGEPLGPIPWPRRVAIAVVVATGAVLGWVGAEGGWSAALLGWPVAAVVAFLAAGLVGVQGSAGWGLMTAAAGLFGGLIWGAEHYGWLGGLAGAAAGFVAGLAAAMAILMLLHIVCICCGINPYVPLGGSPPTPTADAPAASTGSADTTPRAG